MWEPVFGREVHKKMFSASGSTVSSYILAQGLPHCAGRSDAVAARDRDDRL